MRIFVQSAGEGGVAFYRTIQPYGYIADNCDCDVFFNDIKKFDMQRIAQEIEAADILVMQMPYGQKFYEELVKNKKRAKPKLIVAEFDDNIFDIHPLNDAYRNFGQKKVIKYFTDIQQGKYERDKWKVRGMDRELKVYEPSEQFKIGDSHIVGEIAMWEDGKDGFNIDDNKKRMEFTKLTIRDADLVTVTTDYLGKVMRKHRPQGAIAVLPNLIDMKRWLPMDKNDTGEIRIGWAGGQAHYQDIFMIRKALWDILDKYPNVKFVMKGGIFENMFHEKHSKQIDWIPWHSDINTYPLDIKKMKLDIAICPVVDDRFNRSKSELKWLEFSAMKVPTVCSRVTYGGVVNYGKTGFIAETHDDWVNCLSKLIESEELRKEIGQKAYDRVANYHNVENSVAWYELLRDARFHNLKGVKKAKTIL